MDRETQPHADSHPLVLFLREVIRIDLLGLVDRNPGDADVGGNRHTTPLQGTEYFKTGDKQDVLFFQQG